MKSYLTQRPAVKWILRMFVLVAFPFSWNDRATHQAAILPNGKAHCPTDGSDAALKELRFQ